MAEPNFDLDLERLFNQAPQLSDSEAFARKVESNLNRSWRIRTLAIGSAGAIGGLVATSQALGAGFGLKLRAASTNSAEAVDSVYRETWNQLESLTQAGSGMSLFWMFSGLMILAAVVIGAAKVFEEV